MNAKKIHVGELIKEAVKERGYSLSYVAKQIGISRQVFNGWLKKDDIPVKDLFTISESINYDLVKFFCLPEKNEVEQETKVILQIEVDKSKTNDVLKYINDKKLYNILKK